MNPSTDLPVDQLVRAHYWMRLTRALDDRLINLYKQGKIAGGIFSQVGHEAISIGAALALAPEDVIAPMHRDVGAYLARGMPLERLIAQYLGRAGGVSGGRDSNLHGCGDLSLGIIGYVSPLPASMPVTAGAAMAFKLRGERRVALTFFGDGSSSEGLTHETLNWAAVFQLPVVFVCENNQFAYSTPLSRQMRIENIADRASGYGFLGSVVDGNDFVSVYQTTLTAVERAREGGGPALIECKTMRMRGHAIHDNMAYVPAELLEEWAARDPILSLENSLRELGAMDDASLEGVRARVEAQIDEAQARAEKSPYPDPSTLTTGVYGPTE